MIPILDLLGMVRVPPNTLASRVDTIRLVFGHVNDNMQGPNCNKKSKFTAALNLLSKLLPKYYCFGATPLW